MIKNIKQLKSAKVKLGQWLKTLEQIENGVSTGQPEWVLSEQKVGVVEQIRQLNTEIKEYEDIESGTIKLPDLCPVLEIPHLLISWRIARRWTQAELASRCEIHENLIQKYESEEYSGAAFSTIRKIATILHEQQCAKKESAHVYR